MATALEDVLSLVTSEIVIGENNEVFHMEWNNLNRVTTNIYENIVNHTGGIMIQKEHRYESYNSGENIQ